MADKELQIKLTAVGAPQAAAEVEKVKEATEGVAEATQEAAKATAQQTAATNPWITASRGMTTALKEQANAEEAVKAAVEQTGQAAEQAEKKIRRKKKAVEETGDAGKKAAGNKGGGAVAARGCWHCPNPCRICSMASAASSTTFRCWWPGWGWGLEQRERCSSLWWELTPP